MLEILSELRSYIRQVRAGPTIATADDYRRGYLEGLRQYYRMERFSVSDGHVRWLVFDDSPEYAEFERGYCDGLVGVEPQPSAEVPSKPS